MQDFAGKTEDIIRGAMINALKAQALEGPIKKIYEQFAKDAESGNALDVQEVANFTDSINKTIEDAAKFAELVEKATGVKISEAAAESGRSNSLAGAIEGIRAEQADVLAGQFGGLRLTAFDQLQVATRSFEVHLKIEANTAAMLSTLVTYYGKWDRSGLKVNV